MSRRPKDPTDLTERSASELSRGMQRAMHTLDLDATTAELIAELELEGVRALLIKGPALTRWLYRDTASRSYQDIDVLVAPSARTVAARVLAKLGFERWDAALSQAELSELAAEYEIAPHAETWARPPRTHVDLHHTIVGVGAGENELWEALASDSEQLSVGGHVVWIPAERSRALIVGLEAAKGGVADEKGLADLGRAMAVVPESVWRESARLAERLQALSAFSAGLRLLPAGAELLVRLGLDGEIDVETALRAQSPPPTAFGFQRLSEKRGLRAKAAFVAREVVPTKVFMRHRFAIASRGALGLLLSYLWRPLWLLAHAGGGFLAWRRARRTAAG
jgi:hypothetical protein